MSSRFCDKNGNMHSACLVICTAIRWMYWDRVHHLLHMIESEIKQIHQTFF